MHGGVGKGAGEAGLFEIIGSLYEAALDFEQMPGSLEQLMIASGCVGGGIHEAYGNAFDPRRITTPGLRAYFDEVRAREYWRIEPRVRAITASRGIPGGAFDRLSRGGIVTDLDVIAAEACDRHPYYQDFLRHHGLRYGVYFWMTVGGRRLVFAGSRAVDAGPPERAELARLGLLRGHLERALRVSARLAECRGVSESLLGLLSSLGMAALLVGAGGRILFANAAAERLDGNGLSLRRGKLSAGHAPDRPGLDRLIGAALGEGLGAPDLDPVALRRAGRQPLLVQAIPVAAAAGEKAGLPFPPPSAIVLIADPEQRAGPDPERPLRLLGLTRAEARIAWWSGQGLSAAEVGRKVGNTEGTVRTSLKRIHHKLGVARQSDLALVVAKASAIAGLGRGAGA